MTAIHIELPEHSSYGEIMKAYFSLMRGFGIELGMRCDAKLTEQEGPEWWSDLIAQRRLDGRWKGTVNLNDPSITLPEYVWGQDSPLALVFSSKPQSKILAKKILVDAKGAYSKPREREGVYLSTKVLDREIARARKARRPTTTVYGGADDLENFSNGRAAADVPKYD